MGCSATVIVSVIVSAKNRTIRLPLFPVLYPSLRSAQALEYTLYSFLFGRVLFGETMTKTVLITGGSRGIGLAIARKYLDTEEYNVVVTGRKEQTLEELTKEVDNKNFHVIAARADDEEAANTTCKNV